MHYTYTGPIVARLPELMSLWLPAKPYISMHSVQHPINLIGLRFFGQFFNCTSKNFLKLIGHMD